MKKFLLLFLIFSLSGCAVAPVLIGPAISGAIMWKQGEAIKFYENHSNTIYNASKRVCQELQLPIIKDQKTKNGYSIIAGTKEKYKISIEKNQENITKVGLRIGIGNIPLTELFYKKLDDEIDTIWFDSRKPDAE
jgi:hypothetical protein